MAISRHRLTITVTPLIHFPPQGLATMPWNCPECSPRLLKKSGAALCQEADLIPPYKPAFVSPH